MSRRTHNRTARSVLVMMVLSVSLLMVRGAHAAIEPYDFETAQQQAQYQRFTEELRCPKCQNQNLAGSDAPIAADLRRELRRLVVDGSSDEEIVDFMVERYGEFVLYQPPLDQHTVALWAAPAVFALIGLAVLIVLLRRRRAGDGHTVEPALSTDEQARVARLLSERGSENGDSTS